MILAFAIVYVIWGSTYLAIRVVVESMPAFLSAGVRFLVAGLLMMGFLRLRGFALPAGPQWRHSWVAGLLLSVGGNGLVVWAEKSISSGLAALLVALTPVWFALLNWLRPGGKRPQLKTVVGIVIGFAGVILLVNGRGAADSHAASFWAAIAVVFAGLSWAGGSLFTKYSPNSGSPLMNAAAQMICGGIGLVAVSLVTGEALAADLSTVTGRSMIALLYLVVFGSWIGFTAYIYLLKVSTPSRVSTYAYVNPVIAVFLGWLVLGETIGPKMLLGALVVLAGVITIAVPASFVGEVGARLRRMVIGQPRALVPCPERD
ncbi:MAG TPA: EamA family transporter [Verrucomicrobiae bacterium]